jgi:hypothetical protein
MFERAEHPLISRAAFAGRMVRWVLLTIVLIALSLLAGVMGYHYFESIPWIDALLSASMILGGMGEIDVLHTTGGKIFAAIYAMYSGMFLVVCGGLLLVPIFHRVLHHFHGDDA